MIFARSLGPSVCIYYYGSMGSCAQPCHWICRPFLVECATGRVEVPCVESLIWTAPWLPSSTALMLTRNHKSLGRLDDFCSRGCPAANCTLGFFCSSLIKVHTICDIVTTISESWSSNGAICLLRAHTQGPICGLVLWLPANLLQRGTKQSWLWCPPHVRCHTLLQQFRGNNWGHLK